MKRKINITVDLKVQQYNSLKLKQMDTTELEISILDESLEIDLSNLSVEMIFTKPDKTIVVQSSNIEKQGNVINITLLPECLRQAGDSNIEIELKKDTEVVSSFYIPVKIEKSSKGNVTSENTPNYFEVLEQASIEEEKRIANEKSRQVAEKDRNSSEEERKSAENIRIESETNRVSEEEKRITNENIRIELEQARKTEEEVRKTSENSRVEAENARQQGYQEILEHVNNNSIIIKKYNLIIATDTAKEEEVTLPCMYKVRNSLS